MKRIIYLFPFLFFVYLLVVGQVHIKQMTGDIIRVDTLRAWKDTSGGSGTIFVNDTLYFYQGFLKVGVNFADSLNVNGTNYPGSDFLLSGSVVADSISINGVNVVGDSLYKAGQVDSLLALQDAITEIIGAQDSLDVKLDKSAFADSMENIDRFRAVAGENISAFDLVYVSGDTIYKADADDTSKVRVVGIVKEDISSGNSGYVYVSGVIENDSWNFIAGMEVYLSATAGEVIQVPPFSNGSVIEKVGIAIANKKLLLYLNGDYILKE